MFVNEFCSGLMKNDHILQQPMIVTFQCYKLSLSILEPLLYKWEKSNLTIISYHTIIDLVTEFNKILQEP